MRSLRAIRHPPSAIDALTPLAGNIPFEVRFFGGAATGVTFCDEFCARVEAREWCGYGGMLGRPELREEFRKASLIVLPSLENNCPMVVLEAMHPGSCHRSERRRCAGSYS